MSVRHWVPWRSIHLSLGLLDLFKVFFFTLYHGINYKLNHHFGEYVFTFSKHQTSKSKDSKQRKKQSLLHEVEKNWGRLENKVHPNYHKIVHSYHKMPFLHSFASISGGAEISDDNHPSTPRLKSSPWRARVARAPKAQAVARDDLFGQSAEDA